MLGIDPRVARYTWTIIAVFLIFAIIYKVREIIFLFIVSLLFAYLLWPLLDYLDRRLPGRSRIPALAAVYIVVMALLAFALVEIGTRVLIEANTLVAKLPAFLSQLQQSKTATLQQSHGSAKSMIIIEIQKLLAEHSQNIVSLMPTLAIKAVAAVRIVVFAILVPILSFFLLQDADKMRNFILTIVPEGLRRRQLIGIGTDLHALLARYVRALVILSGLAFIAYAVFLSAVGLPYAILLAAIEFGLELIPIVGPITGIVLVICVSVFTGFPHLLWIIIFLGVFRIVQDYVVSPRVMGSEMRLHPLAVILAVLAGAELGGIIGCFIAVPIVAMLWIIYSHLRRKRLIMVRDSSFTSP